MMDKQKGKYVFECDTCGAVFETGTSDFDLAQLKRQEEGWKAYRIGDEWEHHCVDCR
jgi:hypothetical protein